MRQSTILVLALTLLGTNLTASAQNRPEPVAAPRGQEVAGDRAHDQTDSEGKAKQKKNEQNDKKAKDRSALTSRPRMTTSVARSPAPMETT